MARRIALGMWIVSLIVLVALSVGNYLQLPERFATHFDFQGNPDGWSSKSSFFTFWFLIMGIVNVWPPLTRLIIERTPPRWLNLPNKAHWLATPERREHAIAVMSISLAATMLFSNAIFIVVIQSIVEHAQGGGFFFSLWWLGAVFLGVTIFGVIYPIAALRIPKGDRP
jgi:uncharacterized membrane protein